MTTRRIARPAGWLGRAVAVAAALAVAAACGTANAEFANPHGVAVIIGNKEYENERVPEVAWAHRDAEAFRRFVLDVLGYDPANVIDLRDATQARMEAAFGNERSHRGKVWRYLHPRHGSDVVVFYSGHGVPGLEDGRGYLLPVDADPDGAEINGYPLDLLYANLGALEATRSVRVFLDACFSGDSDRGRLVRSASPVYVQVALPEASGDKLTVLAAASGKEVASWDDGARHGLFTHHLMDALYGAGDANGDGKVTAAEAKTYLDDTMTLAARREFGRHQNASLNGASGVVLASAGAGGAFPPRPALGEGGGGTEDMAPPPELSAEEVEQALGLTHVQRVLVQRGLAALELDVGWADGVFGRRTRAAIGAYQKEKGLTETGYLTREQAEALEALGEEAQRRAQAERLRDAESKSRKAGEVFRDCAQCPEVVVVPAGTFRMGSPSHEAKRYDNEGPVHEVVIAEPFAVGVHEVTRGQWRAFVSETIHATGNACWTHEGGELKWRSGRSWRNPGFRQSDTHPVLCMSWFDALSYVRWLSRKTGQEYRLLSEAEWEYVARAGSTTSRYWGDSETGQCQYANGADITAGLGYGAECSDDHVDTAAVGTYQANAYGLYDVLGNAWEWTADCWNESYAGAPRDGSAWQRGDCSRRVVRGGSWNYAPGDLRSAARTGYPSGNRNQGIGFRIARALTPEERALQRAEVEAKRREVGEVFRDCAECPEVSAGPTVEVKMRDAIDPMAFTPAPGQPEAQEAQQAPEADDETGAPPGAADHESYSAGHLEYLARLRDRLSQYLRYPSVARERGQMGTAVLRIAVDRNGNVQELELRAGTGHPLLDREALKVVERAQPLPALPEYLRQERLEVLLNMEFVLN